MTGSRPYTQGLQFIRSWLSVWTSGKVSHEINSHAGLFHKLFDVVRDTIETREQRFPVDAELMKLISDCFLTSSGNDRMLNKSCRGVGRGRPKDRRLQVRCALEWNWLPFWSTEKG
jgi:hypothetical protein